MKETSQKLKPVGWNLTIDSKEQLYRIAAFLRVKRTRAVLEIIDILLTQLVNEKSFQSFVDAYDRLHDVTKDRSVYTSFYIPPAAMKRFEDVMYDFGFIDRSPFLRVIINYIYNHKVRPINEETLPKIKADIEQLGYKIKAIGPILEGDIYFHIQNPDKKSTRKRKMGR